MKNKFNLFVGMLCLVVGLLEPIDGLSLAVLFMAGLNIGYFVDRNIE